MRAEQTWAVLGIIVSLYSIYIEKHASEEADFVALCDFTDSVSCSKVFTKQQTLTRQVLTSPYARLLGLAANLPEDHFLNVPNTYLG